MGQLNGRMIDLKTFTDKEKIQEKTTHDKEKIDNPDKDQEKIIHNKKRPSECIHLDDVVVKVHNARGVSSRECQTCRARWLLKKDSEVKWQKLFRGTVL